MPGRLVRSSLVASLLMVLLVGPGVAARPSVTLENIASSPHHAPEGASLGEIGQWIAVGASRGGWVLMKQEPGRMTLRLEVRRHVAMVDVTYDETDFSIAYRDSINLNYSEKGKARFVNKRRIEIPGPRIHRNYNRWVNELADEIRISLVNPPRLRDLRDSPPEAPSQPFAASLADEIERLAGQRDRGLLTDEEFEKAKAKLLRP